MKKKLIWLFNALLLSAIIAFLAFHHIRERPVSSVGCHQAFSKLAQSIQKYEKNHGEMPVSLADLERPRLTSYRGLPIIYINNASNFVLSVKVPPLLVSRLSGSQKKELEKATKKAIPNALSAGRLTSVEIRASFSKQ